MDELKLRTKFLKGIVAKIISKAISKKFGCDINILIDELEIENKDGKVHIHANLRGEANTSDIATIIESITMD